MFTGVLCVPQYSPQIPQHSPRKIFSVKNWRYECKRSHLLKYIAHIISYKVFFQIFSGNVRTCLIRVWKSPMMSCLSRYKDKFRDSCFPNYFGQMDHLIVHIELIIATIEPLKKKNPDSQRHHVKNRDLILFSG